MNKILKLSILTGVGIILFFYTKAIEAEIIYSRPVMSSLTELDTRKPPSESEVFVYNQIFDTLFDFEKNGEIKSGLVKSWKNGNNGHKFELVLKENIYFHDNTLLVPEDVKYSLERIKKFKGYVSNSLKNLSRIRVNSKKNLVTLILKRPNPKFLLNLTDANLSIIKKGETSKKLNGTGPFYLFKRGKQDLLLKKFKLYHGTEANIDTLKIILMSKESAIEDFKNRKIDDLFQYMLNASDRDSLKEICQWEFAKLPTMRFLVVKANTSKLTSKKNYRDCLISIIDRIKLSSELEPGQPILEKFLPKGIIGGNLLSDYSQQNFCSAGTLKAISKLSKILPLRILGSTTKTNFSKLLSKYLTNKGINTQEISVSNVTNFFQIINTNKIDIYTARFTPRAPDIESFLYAFLGKSPFWPTDFRATNDKFLAPIEAESNPPLRLSKISRSFLDLQEKKVIVPLVQFEFYGCYQKKWKNILIPSNGFIGQKMNYVSIL